MTHFEIFSENPSEDSISSLSKASVLENGEYAVQTDRAMTACVEVAMWKSSIRAMTNAVEQLDLRMRRMEDLHKLEQSRLDRRLSRILNRFALLESNAVNTQSTIRMGLMILEEKFRLLELRLDLCLHHLKHLHSGNSRPPSIRSWPAGARAHLSRKENLSLTRHG